MNNENEEFDDELDCNDPDLDENDYVFIVGPDGELKTLLFPDNLMDDLPKAVQKILKIFKIKDIHDLEPKTIH